jgi:membrane protein YdbS with pleckstrin-like domain
LIVIRGIMRAQNDNADTGGGHFAPSALALFLPAAVIIGGYGLLLALLAVAGKADGAIARLCMIVLALAAPFLVAHAVLRRITTRVDVFSHAVHLQPGFPSNQRHVVPYALIRAVRVRRGPGGRLAGSGTLSIELTNGGRIAACDLAAPELARQAIEARRSSPKTADLPAQPAEMPEILRISSG